MIRVIYRWEIDDAAREDFVQEWQQLTEWIRTNFDGAYGSTLLEPGDQPQAMVGVARWASIEHLATFREQGGSLHLPGATLTSMDILTELAHLTDERHPEQ